MRRRFLHEEHENHERWLISYADFITLLFAFFVVMYSVSSVNEGKYRVLSDSLDAAFRAPNRSIHPIQTGQVTPAASLITTDPEKPISGIGLSNLPPPRFSEPISQEAKDAANTKDTGVNASKSTRIEKLSKVLVKALNPLIAQGLVDVSHTDDWIEVAINSSILFPSGSAQLSRQSIPVLEKIASLLKPVESSIHVEGFTDNVPINSQVYPSNWELSAARAASVVHLFSKSGIEAVRLAAVGYGEHHPVATNRTDGGRQKNRRVVLLVNASPSPRFLQLRKRHSQAKKSATDSLKTDRTSENSAPLSTEIPEIPTKRGVLPVLPVPFPVPPLPADVRVPNNLPRISVP